MFRFSRFAGALVLASVLAFGCSGRQASPDLPAAEPSIQGIITHVDPAGEAIGRILVEENPAQSAGSAKASVRITQGTRIVTVAGERARGSFQDLAVGRRARVWFTGPVMESYPVQATAEVVAVEP